MKKIKVDKSKCTGCKICQIVCSTRFSDGGVNIKNAALRVKEINLIEDDFPVICLHCGGKSGLTKAGCSTACPNDAFAKDENSGALYIIKEKCNGCGVCVEKCPFDVLAFSEELGMPLKCDLCSDREGGPLCVEYCPTGALTWEDSNVKIEENRDGGNGNE